MVRIAKEKMYKEISYSGDNDELEKKIGKAGVMKIIDKFCNELRKPKPIPDEYILHCLLKINSDPYTNISDFSNNTEIRKVFWDFILED